ncbi:MAG: Fic family protein [Bacteroidota bacterium]
MRPPYELTSRIIRSIASIAQKVGRLDVKFIAKQSPELRKDNRIKTIHSSLGMEGNTLSEEQITALMENKRVVGPAKDIREVLNALETYRDLKRFHYKSEKDFLRAHKLLMNGLVKNPGKCRTQGVGIVKGSNVRHIAPPRKNVPYLMADLFNYLHDDTELSLIKSCVFHYEMEFIHPFMDGNGRMGRLWQTVILMAEYPVFEYLPFETLIAKNQSSYYKSLSASDKQGKSTKFIEFMLTVIEQSLDELLQTRSKRPDAVQRLLSFLEQVEGDFSRGDYMLHFPEISSATASRDLRSGVEQKLIKKTGDKKTTRYRLVTKKG